MTRTTEDDQTGSPGFDVRRWFILGLIAVAALMVLGSARSRIVAPFDNVVTEQICLRHGEELERTLVDFERSNNLALRDRTDGYCSYGPGSDGEPSLLMTIEETKPGALYLWAKAIGIILQLGIASIFVRLVTDPLLETYRFFMGRLSTDRG